MIGEVSAKSRLLKFRNTEKSRIPFLFEIFLRDQTGTIRLQFWNETALLYYSVIQVGYCISIEHVVCKAYVMF